MIEKHDIGIEVELPSAEHFAIILETLTRLGIASKKSKTLYQSCHLLHKKGRYYVVHYKELFLLDNKQADISEDDYRRRNRIAKFLHEWKLCKVLNKSELEFLVEASEIKIVPHKEKKDWSLIAKYTIGKKKCIVNDTL